MTDPNIHEDRCWGAAIVLLLLTTFLYWAIAAALDYSHNLRPFEDLTIAPIILVVPLTIAVCRFSRFCQPATVAVYLLAFALPFGLILCSIVGLDVSVGEDKWPVGYWGAPTIFTAIIVALCFCNCRKKPDDKAE